MVRATEVLYYAIHFQQLRNILQWKVWHEAIHQRDPEKESESLRKCFYYLDMTSRSFSSVIQELHPELLVPVALFYLILRGLDTIEDDMTISLAAKTPLLRDFYKIVNKEGWNYDGNGPNEKDRELLVHFEVVTEEFNKIKPVYQDIIRDIAKQMGNGMADYCANAEHNEHGVDTISDYDLYCYYVAGLVGNGLTRLFFESGFAHPALLKNASYHTSMGLFLQKTNIIRDVKEDFDDKRIFWPKEIWSRHVDKFEDLFKPENENAALNCSSDMVLNALYHAIECMQYLAGLKEQSVFNFAAIPQAMAIATLEVVFRNPQIFKRNVKITKGEACRIMTMSTQNNQTLSGIFKDYTRRIHKKNTPRDPNFLKISIQCGKIEQYIESVFPTQDHRLMPGAGASQPKALTIDEAEQKKMEAEAKQDTIYILAAVVGVVLFMSLSMIGVAWLFGARFDIVFSQMFKGNFQKPDATAAATLAEKYDRGEL